jgi:hypothetical protein
VNVSMIIARFPMQNSRPSRVAIVDVETTPITPGRIPKTKFWGLGIENGPYYRFKTCENLLKFLVKNPGIRCYFHHDYEITQMLVEGITPATMRSRGSRIIRAYVAGSEWINSYALFPSPLSEILESAGFEKHPLNYGDHPLACQCKLCWEALEIRNYSDCVEAMIAFRQISNAYKSASGIDPIEEGIATSASAAFRAAENVAGRLPANLHYRACYRGGRVEAFKLDNCGPAESWDINSSYPYAFTDAPQKDRLIHAKVEIETGIASPFFRFAPDDKKKKFLFPIGSFETIFFESNYERYIRPYAGGIVKSIDVIESVTVDLGWISRVAPLMKRAYALRKISKAKGDKTLTYALKIFMNSTYGRIGMRPVREQCTIRSDLPTDCGYYPLPNGKFLVFTSHFLASTRANYQLAGWITDNARARLWAGLANSIPYYCDTDGIKCKPGSFKIPSGGKELGDWKPEGTEPLYVHTVKDYVFGVDKKTGKPKVTRKGGEKHTQWTVKTVLSGKGVIEVNKTRKTEYDKREVYAGGYTRPLLVWE